MSLNPTTWSVKANILTWLPLGAFALTVILNWNSLSNAFPLATKDWVNLRLAMSDEVRQSDRMDTLQYQIGQLRVQAFTLEESLQANPSREKRLLLQDLNEGIADKKRELQGLECALLHRCLP